MINIKSSFTNLLKNIFILNIIIFALFVSTKLVFAASTPTLTLTNNSSTISINVIGADQYATVKFYYPNNSTYTTFSSIDIGQTDSTGSYNVSVAPNSYGLNAGYPVYVSVDGQNSQHIPWLSNLNNQTNQASGSLSLSEKNVTLNVGQDETIISINSSKPLTVTNNTNSSIATASIIPFNTLDIYAMNAGSTILTICAGSDGCNTVNVTVQASNQSVNFSQSVLNIVLGQAPQTISIYGPGTYYGLSNSNQNVITASTSGSNLIVSGFAVGQSVVSLCATGWQCGSLTVNVLPSGSSVPTATILPATDYTNKPPQISSFSMTSNNVQGAFFGSGTTLSMNLKSNESVTNVQVKVNGIQTAVGDAGNSSYGASYTFTGNETLPLPISISFANSNGQIGQFYYWIGNSPSTLSPNSTIQPSIPTVSSSNSYTFSKYLYMGMTKLNVSDSEVTNLQKYLKEKGIYSGPITGYFGQLTKTAVEAYQKKHNLDPIGVVGPSTRVLLNSGK